MIHGQAFGVYYLTTPIERVPPYTPRMLNSYVGVSHVKLHHYLVFIES